MDVAQALSDLEENDFFVWDDFLSDEEVQAVVRDFTTHLNSGAFKTAGVSSHTPDVRKDISYWLDPLNLTPSQMLFWRRLEGLKEKINQRFLLGLWSLGGHYSSYPVNGFYRQHLDRFSHNDQRTVSMVIYLNGNWVSGDGGELRIHPESRETSNVVRHKPIDVAPIAGRLVCFLSSKVLHEVLECKKERISFAGWWKRRE